MIALMKQKTLILGVVAMGLLIHGCGRSIGVSVVKSEFISIMHKTGKDRLNIVVRNKAQFDDFQKQYHFRSIPLFVETIEWGNDTVLIISEDAKVGRATIMSQSPISSSGVLVVTLVDVQQSGYGFSMLKGDVNRYIKFTVPN